MKQPAFTGRAAPAYRVLEAWVYLTAGNGANPPAPPAVPPPEIKPAAPAVPPPDVKPVLPPVPPPPMPPATGAPKFGEDAGPSGSTPPNPESQGAAVDDFDPSVYNRAVQAKPPTK
jgi:hypothetical protein